MRLDEHGGISLREAEKALRVNGAVLLKLIDRGYVLAEQAINPRNRCPQTIVKRGNLDAFQAKFISLYWLAEQNGIHIRRMKRELDDAGICAAITAEEVNSTFFARGDVGRWLMKGNCN